VRTSTAQRIIQSPPGHDWEAVWSRPVNNAGALEVLADRRRLGQRKADLQDLG
jgi:hypothetical protein